LSFKRRLLSIIWISFSYRYCVKERERKRCNNYQWIIRLTANRSYGEIKTSNMKRRCWLERRLPRLWVCVFYTNHIGVLFVCRYSLHCWFGVQAYSKWILYLTVFNANENVFSCYKQKRDTLHTIVINHSNGLPLGMNADCDGRVCW